MAVPATTWAPGMRITAARLNATDIQRGNVLVSFTTQTSFQLVVPFPELFPAAPIMSVNIASGAGSTSRWGARAINITQAQFTLFVYRGEAAAAAATWANVPVDWIAINP
ncbi:hypothetical protein [Streptomyces halstedii]|uniref:hypothetical protein n=1 Tax=Streptomyces halstedii TaxID=1944 RepID=UPI003348A19C